MEIIHKTIPAPKDCYTDTYLKNNTAFFDIETTGFSAKNCFIYLIGLVIRKDETLEIFQFFAENPMEEKEILTAFYRYLSPVSTLICYNGLTFDIPFLKQRTEKQNLSFSWENFRIMDIYQEMRPFLNLLHLPDKKQKTLEMFLGIQREDSYTGGELVAVYKEYEKQPAEEKKSLLLLHNYEDILGMTKLLPLFSYLRFFAGEPDITSAKLEETLPFGADSPKKELQITLNTSLPFPARLTVEKEMYRLTFRENHVYLFIPVLEGELYFYYENYKDYYYLPLEDMAVHKSVASYVDKNFRIQAAAATCYVKKPGCFLPQYQELFSPALKQKYQDKTSYFELTEAFTNSKENLKTYAMHLLACALHK